MSAQKLLNRIFLKKKLGTNKHHYKAMCRVQQFGHYPQGQGHTWRADVKKTLLCLLHNVLTTKTFLNGLAQIITIAIKVKVTFKLNVKKICAI